jgi:hypothetical protein
LRQKIAKQGVIDELPAARSAVVETAGAALEGVEGDFAVGALEIVGLGDRFETERLSAAGALLRFAQVHVETARAAHGRDRRSAGRAATE